MLSGKAPCPDPLHEDRHASCSIRRYPDKDRFKCWACGASGDAIDFLRLKTGCTYRQALGRLGLAVSVPLSKSERAEAEKRRRQWQDDRDLVSAYEAWIDREVDRLGLLIRCIQMVMAAWETPEDITDLGGMVHQLPRLEYEFQILTEAADESERLSFIKFKTRGKQSECDSGTNQRS